MRLVRGGHARARAAQEEAPICRKVVIASGRPCPRIPLGNLHGKEGVDGSSPSEGSAKTPHVALFRSERLALRRTCGGYGAIYGAFKQRGRAELSARPGRRSTAAGAVALFCLALVAELSLGPGRRRTADPARVLRAVPAPVVDVRNTRRVDVEGHRRLRPCGRRRGARCESADAATLLAALPLCGLRSRRDAVRPTLADVFLDRDT
jgi:hypothetical protein